MEIASEAFGLGAFLFSACFFAVLLEHPASPTRAAIPSDLERRALMGLAMGITAILLIYSPPAGVLGLMDLIGSLQNYIP